MFDYDEIRMSFGADEIWVTRCYPYWTNVFVLVFMNEETFEMKTSTHYSSSYKYDARKTWKAAWHDFRVFRREAREARDQADA